MQSPLDGFDPLRDGLRNMKEQCRSGHEVEAMQKEVCWLMDFVDLRLSCYQQPPSRGLRLLDLVTPACFCVTWACYVSGMHLHTCCFALITGDLCPSDSNTRLLEEPEKYATGVRPRSAR